MKIYGNIDSKRSLIYLAQYDDKLLKIEMSFETEKMIKDLNSGVSTWLNSHNHDYNSSLGLGIICGVTE